MLKKTMASAMRGEALRARVEAFSEELAMTGCGLAFQSADLRRQPSLLAETADRVRRQHEQLLVADEELRAQMLELEEATQRLAQERKRYQELFQFAPDPMFYTDRTGSVRDANPAACKMLGIEHRFLVGKPLVAFVERTDVNRFRELTSRIANIGPMESKLSMQARSGATEEVLLRGQVLEDRHHIVWIARRIDERFAVNERISVAPASEGVRESGDRFVAVRADRTDELTAELRRRDEQLDSERRRSGELEAASEAKDRSLAMVSHELRGPINVVLGWTNLLRSIERNARASCAGRRLDGCLADCRAHPLADDGDARPLHARVVHGRGDRARGQGSRHRDRDQGPPGGIRGGRPRPHHPGIDEPDLQCAQIHQEGWTDRHRARQGGDGGGPRHSG